MVPTIGCNALARSFLPTILVTADKPMTEEIQKRYPEYLGYHIFKTKPKSGWTVMHKGQKEEPLDVPGWASGGVALYSACFYFHPTQVIVVGFDMGWTLDNKINNLYAGTPNYKVKGSRPTDASNFTKQFQTVAQQFNQVIFFRIIPCKDAINAKLTPLQNVHQILYGDPQIEKIIHLT
jgi:hypothetical protein